MPTIKAQPEALNRVFENLLINAIQHHDQEDGRIRIAYRDKEDSYEFRISDDGPGIPKEYQAKVFDLFHTLQSEHNIQTHSTGIGLYLVRRTLDILGGDIEIESNEPRGTTFKVTCPKTP